MLETTQCFFSRCRLAVVNLGRGLEETSASAQLYERNLHVTEVRSVNPPE